MRERYKNEIERIAKSSVMDVSQWRRDVAKFKKDFGFLWGLAKRIAVSPAGRLLFGCSYRTLKYFGVEDTRTQPPPIEESPMAKYFIDDSGPVALKRPSVFYKPRTSPIFQKFSLPSSLIYSITKSAPDDILQKLYFASTYFFLVRKTPICYKIDVANYDSTEIYENTLFLNPRNSNLLNHRHWFHLTKVLSIHNISSVSLTQLLPRIAEINIVKLSLFFQILTLEEFRAMAPKVEVFQFYRTCRIYDGSRRIPITEILNEMPKVKHANFFLTWNKISDNVELKNPQNKIRLESFCYVSMGLHHQFNFIGLCKIIKVKI